MKTIDALYEDAFQTVLQGVRGYRLRRPDEECSHCHAPPGEPCRNTFNPTETYRPGHLQKSTEPSE